MTRPAPRLSVPELCAVAVLQPSGAHVLELGGPGHLVTLTLGLDQVRQLEQHIEEFRALAAAADGGPELLRVRPVPLGVR